MKPVSNPPNPFQSHDCCYLEGIEAPAQLQIYEDATRSILSRNDSPDLGFRWSLNPYRGCSHACAYCYARPSHEYLGFGAGSDFDSKILIKRKAAELLRASFMKKSWKGEMVVFSGDTDCYQPLEASYQLTQQCLKVCLEFGNPVGIITKSYMILRDFELLKQIHKRTRLWVVVSIPFFDEKIGRLIEPGAAAVSKRFEVIGKLSAAGIYTSVAVAPLIPALNDDQMPDILKRAKDCGAQGAFMSLVRLPGNAKDVFISRIKMLFPLRCEKIIGRLKQMREGNIYQAEFGKRHRGSGDYWENLEKLFRLTCQKTGLNENRPKGEPGGFKRPEIQQELSLFE